MSLNSSQARAAAQRYNDLILNEPYRMARLGDEALQHTVEVTGASESTVQEVSRMMYDELNDEQKQIFTIFYSYISEHGL